MDHFWLAFLYNCFNILLFLACKYGYVSCVELLLRYNGRANISNSISGQTPLFIAANKNHVDCVSFLINYAADANISNKDGLLPLHTAVWANSIPCLRVLIPVTDKNLITQYGGMTPVQLAVFRHNVEALQVSTKNLRDILGKIDPLGDFSSRVRFSYVFLFQGCFILKAARL